MPWIDNHPRDPARREDFPGPRHATAMPEAEHLAALHRGLLIVLSLVILVLVPIIASGGSTGEAWTSTTFRLPPPAGTPRDAGVTRLRLGGITAAARSAGRIE